MVVRAFPPVENADEYGLLAVGGDLEPASVILAYSSGIFPWPWDEKTPLLWFSPPQRGVLFLDEFTPPRRFLKEMRRRKWTVTFDVAPDRVIEACARSPHRAHDGKTWITSGMIEAYQRLAAQGIVHSVETWNGSELVGGLYGVSLGGMFAGESMFFHESGASKCALVGLVERLRSLGLRWMDCQQVSPLLAQFGAREIPRAEFQELLRSALEQPPLQFSS